MYEELVKRLNEKARVCDENWDVDTAVILEQAANAIAELSNKRVGTWHRVKATQRSYSFVCNSCGYMFPYLTRCCSNCGVEYIDEEPTKKEELV